MKKVICFVLTLILLVGSAAHAEYTQMEKGAKGNAVSQLQTRLKELGFYSISVDGDYGNGTVNAIKAFEEYNGLEPTGIASVELQELLYSEKALGLEVPDVEISALGMRKSYGYYFARPTLLNHTDTAIDTLTVCIRAYNAYGERLGYRVYTLSDVLTTDNIQDYNLQEATIDLTGLKLKANGKYTLSGAQEIDFYQFDSQSMETVYMAITRYRTAEGDLIEIPENDLVWYGSNGRIETREYENNVKPIAELTPEIEDHANSFILGITNQYLSNFFCEVAGIPMGGVYLYSVEESSPAADAGLRPGDIIVKIGDIWTFDEKSLILAKGLMDTAGTTPVVFYRKGERRETEMATF